LTSFPCITTLHHHTPSDNHLTHFHHHTPPYTIFTIRHQMPVLDITPGFPTLPSFWTSKSNFLIESCL
jgi:hypothetical protein